MLLSQDDVHKSADEWPKERDPPQIGRSSGSQNEERVCEVRRAEERVCEVREGEVVRRDVAGKQKEEEKGREER